jgi:hypothetical protein
MKKETLQQHKEATLVCEKNKIYVNNISSKTSDNPK